MTTEQKIHVLREDFLNRNGENYTSAERSGRLGWEQTLSSGSAYSTAMLSPKDDADLHRIAYNHARDMIVAMNTPFKVRIALTPDASFTDSKVVSVATDMFDDSRLSVGQKIDIFTGLAIHEGSHLLYTDFRVMPRAKNRIVADLFNIIEDERIEMLTGQERPGLANFLGCVKYYYFDRHSTRMQASSAGAPPERSVRLINSILSMIRYPKAMEEDDLREFADTLYDVRDVILPYPKTCAEAFSAAQRIFDIIKRFFNQEQKKSAPKEAKGGEGNGSGTQGRQTSLSDEQLEKMLGSILDSLEKDVTGQPSDGTTPAGMKPERMSGAIRKDGTRLGKALEGELEIGATDRVNIHFPEADKRRYDESLSRVRRYVPAFSSILRRNGTDRVRDLRGLRSGLLDTGKLAEAVQGVPTVYKRQGEVRSDRACVCMLVDESGSMCRQGRMAAARNTAVLLNEALSPIPNIDLYIYGHTADDERDGLTELNIYREKGYAPKFALGSLEARANNRDGTAILETATRVRRQTDEEVLMFIISDGAPAAESYFGSKAFMHTKECVEKAESMGFRIVQICINACYDPAMMFRHYINMEELGTLARDLGREIARALSTKIKSRVI